MQKSFGFKKKDHMSLQDKKKTRSDIFLNTNLRESVINRKTQYNVRLPNLVGNIVTFFHTVFTFSGVYTNSLQSSCYSLHYMFSLIVLVIGKVQTARN